MTTLSAEYQAHLDAGVTTRTKCLLVTRKDGLQLGFTEHDQDIVFPPPPDSDGITYSAADGVTISAIRSTLGGSVDSVEISGALSDTGISAAAIRAGRYAGARGQVFEVNWADLTMGAPILKKGPLGQFTVTDHGYKVELLGLSQYLSRQFIRTYGPTCPVDLGGVGFRQCNRDLTDLTETGAVTAVSDPLRIFAATITGSRAATFFDRGFLTWTSGRSDGLKTEVLSEAAGTVTLWLPTEGAIEIGDTFSIVAGCDKSFATCRDKFANAANFQGQPFVPGLDKATAVPRSI